MPTVTLIGGPCDGKRVQVERWAPLERGIESNGEFLRVVYLPHSFWKGRDEFRLAWLHESLKPEDVDPADAFRKGVGEFWFDRKPLEPAE